MDLSKHFVRAAPSVTIFVFAYNQEQYVRSACESVLSQDYTEPMEIIFSDDCSTDATFTIMSEVAANYAGKHTLILNKNVVNLGLIAHVNLSNQLSSGHLCVVAAGDDISMRNRVTKLVEAYRCAAVEPSTIHSSVINMSPDGMLLNEETPPILNLSEPKSFVLSNALVIGATHAWTKESFNVFGDITERDAYEDLIVAFRSFLLNKILYVDEPLVQYRNSVGILSLVEREHRHTLHYKKIKTLNSLKVYIAVLKQRQYDCMTINNDYLAGVAKSNIEPRELEFNLLTGRISFLKALVTCASFKGLNVIRKAFRKRFLQKW